MLNTQVTQLNYDDMYEALIAAHRGLSTDESHAMNARLVLLLANHISDIEVLKNAFTLARGNQAQHAQTISTEPQAVTPMAPIHSKS